MSAAGGGSVKNGDAVVVGSFIESGGSCVGCGSSISLLKWEECDTVGKIVGFVIGKIVNFITINGGRHLQNAIQLFYLDKASDYFFRFMRWSGNQLYNGVSRLSEFISEYFKPIYTATRPLASWVYNRVLIPIGQAIQRAVKFIFNTLFWDSIIMPIYKWIIYPIFQRVFSHSTSDDRIEQVRKNVLIQSFFDGLKKLSDWTFVPLYKHILSPIAQLIGDFTFGIISGVLRTSPLVDQPSEEEIGR